MNQEIKGNKDGWYEFSGMIKGVDFMDEEIVDELRKKITIAFLEIVKKTGKAITVATVSVTKGTTKEIYSPSTVDIS